MRKLFSELVGTYILVFTGTGAIVANVVSQGAVTHVGISLVFGLVVLALIQALGDVSGAHINPAVTIAFFAAGKLPFSQALGYILFQCLGAILASVSLWALFPSPGKLGMTLPAGSPWQSFWLEVFLTWFLMLTVFQVAHGSYERGLLAGITVGAVIALEALFAGPISGASMNPARSLGPALVMGDLTHLWIYLCAPVLGSVLAIPCHRLLHEQSR